MPIFARRTHYYHTSTHLLAHVTSVFPVRGAGVAALPHGQQRPCARPSFPSWSCRSRTCPGAAPLSPYLWGGSWERLFSGYRSHLPLKSTTMPVGNILPYNQGKQRYRKTGIDMTNLCGMSHKTCTLSSLSSSAIRTVGGGTQIEMSSVYLGIVSHHQANPGSRPLPASWPSSGGGYSASLRFGLP